MFEEFCLGHFLFVALLELYLPLGWLGMEISSNWGEGGCNSDQGLNRDIIENGGVGEHGIGVQVRP